MTIFDLLFLALAATAVLAVIVMMVLVVRGRWARAYATPKWFALLAAFYISIVYVTTAVSSPIVREIGEAPCNDEWCLEVDAVKQTPAGRNTRYDVSLKIFSKARAKPQRELIAKDVYLVDANWQRYDPILTGSEIPLDVLLQPGQSLITMRVFELPTGVPAVGLKIAHQKMPPVCLIIGECAAFHKGPMIRIR